AGLELRTGAVVTGLEADSRRVRAVQVVDTSSGQRSSLSADRIILAAGALATPHILLASRLERQNPGGRAIGRYLMRHCNAMMYGYFRDPPNPDDQHHKQLAIHDYYFGDPRAPSLRKLG